MNVETDFTSEFPLQDVRKQDVIMALDMLGLTSYDVEKPENLIEHYSSLDAGSLYILTKVYHDIKMINNSPSDFPSLHSFIKNEALSFTKNGVEHSVDKEIIQSYIEREMLNLIGRATGLKGLGDMIF